MYYDVIIVAQKTLKFMCCVLLPSQLRTEDYRADKLKVGYFSRFTGVGFNVYDVTTFHNRNYKNRSVITFDQPLWYKALTLIKNERLSTIVCRLGGFHLLMSFFW